VDAAGGRGLGRHELECLALGGALEEGRSGSRRRSPPRMPAVPGLPTATRSDLGRRSRANRRRHPGAVATVGTVDACWVLAQLCVDA
jgi:hypothetical protein